MAPKAAVAAVPLPKVELPPVCPPNGVLVLLPNATSAPKGLLVGIPTGFMFVPKGFDEETGVPPNGLVEDAPKDELKAHLHVLTNLVHKYRSS